MRNWNSKRLLVCLISFSSLYLTYEELKHASFKANVFFVSAVYILPMRNWNGPGLPRIWALVLVYILPMRNWNLSVSLATEAGILRLYLTYEELKLYYPTVLIGNGPLFISYLWRIETKYVLGLKMPVTKFISYLWGIEIKQPDTNIIFHQQFISYLWGFETWWAYSFNKLINILLDPIT